MQQTLIDVLLDNIRGKKLYIVIIIIIITITIITTIIIITTIVIILFYQVLDMALCTLHRLSIFRNVGDEYSLTVSDVATR